MRNSFTKIHAVDIDTISKSHINLYDRSQLVDVDCCEDHRASASHSTFIRRCHANNIPITTSIQSKMNCNNLMIVCYVGFNKTTSQYRYLSILISVIERRRGEQCWHASVVLCVLILRRGTEIN